MIPSSILWASPFGRTDGRTIDKPDPLSNCSVSHQSSESLQIGCNEGFSGGLPQNFLLEIFAIDVVAANTAGSGSQETASLRPSPAELKTNQTSMKPIFIVRGLDADTAYMAHVTAVNAKGRSEPFAVRIVTLRPPETQKNIGPGKSEGSYFTLTLPLCIILPFLLFFCLLCPRQTCFCFISHVYFIRVDLLLFHCSNDDGTLGLRLHVIIPSTRRRRLDQTA